MARVQTMVQLDDELVKRLDDAAGRRGVSRSALIRELVDDGLRRKERDLIGEQIAEGYRRIPQDAADEWGDPLGGADEEEAALSRRLDAEERGAGSRSWR